MFRPLGYDLIYIVVSREGLYVSIVELSDPNFTFTIFQITVLVFTVYMLFKETFLVFIWLN